MSSKIEWLQSSLKAKEGTTTDVMFAVYDSTTGLEQSLVESKREIETLQEMISSLSVQLMDKEEKSQQLMEEMRGTHCTITVEELLL